MMMTMMMVSEVVRQAWMVSVVGGNYPCWSVVGPLCVAGAQCAPLSPLLSLSPLTVSWQWPGGSGRAVEGCWVPAPECECGTQGWGLSRAASQSAELTTCTNKISCDNNTHRGDRVSRLIRVTVRDMVDTIAYTPRGTTRAWQQETLGEATVRPW